MPLMYLKLFGAAAIVAIVVGGYWYIDNKGYQRGNAAGKAEIQVKLDKVQTEYNNYREKINVQVQKAIIEKAQLEAIQNAKHDKTKRDYADTRANLDSILDLLRSGAIVLRQSPMPLAGHGSSTLPSQATNTSEIVIPIRTFPGGCSFEFYAAAMRDNLQCKTLIDFVSEHK